MNKKSRHNFILNLIKEENISTQDELVSFLNQSGFPVTQATVSRDIRELGLTKASDGDGSGYRYMSEESQNATKDKLISVFTKAVVSFTTASNIVVVKTLPGMADACASAIDALNFHEAVGTVAGDDTIFVAAKSPLMANRLVHAMEMVLQNK